MRVIPKVTYTPDNGMVKGMGGLMMGAGTARVAETFGLKYQQVLAAVAIAAEAEATAAKLPPGRITELFARGSRKHLTVVHINDGGHLNPRVSSRVYVEGSYEGIDRATGLPKSSPTTIEFGSRYEEGTGSDRPALHIMGRAVAAAVRRRGFSGGYVSRASAAYLPGRVL